jgi:RNase P subunit RPR2
MAEKEFKAETYLVEYYCDDCNTPIVHNKIGARWENEKPYISHKCPNCNRLYEFEDLKYPYTRVKYKR